MLKHQYESEDWNWRCRVAFMFIIGHMVILILPFFSVMFLLMDILGEGSSQGKGTRFDDSFEAYALSAILILLIGIFFSEMITLFSKPFSTLVTVEVILLITYFLTEYYGHAPAATHFPLGIIGICTVIKMGCAYWSANMEKAKNFLLKKGPGKIV